jgi:hypothetical protein
LVLVSVFKSKNQNSILLLTTLGVYFGLLMAGATPGVIAQQSAAMTRNFELSEEIETRDDLDLDPKSGDVETEFKALLLDGSARAVLRVYLEQFAADAADHDVVHFRDRSAAVTANTLASSQEPKVPLVFPNDVSSSSSFLPACLPRANLDAPVS